jgi:hypothetical protein
LNTINFVYFHFGTNVSSSQPNIGIVLATLNISSGENDMAFFSKSTGLVKNPQ